MNADCGELGAQDTFYVLSDPPENRDGEKGFVDAALMDRLFSGKEFSEWFFVMCGCTIMIDIAEYHLIEQGHAFSPYHLRAVQL